MNDGVAILIGTSAEVATPQIDRLAESDHPDGLRRNVRSLIGSAVLHGINLLKVGNLATCIDRRAHSFEDEAWAAES